MPIYSVTHVSRYLRDLLDQDRNLVDLWVGGEVSSLSTSTAGHTYFTLKDSAAQLRCVMFRNNNAGSSLLTHGSLVVAHGRLNFYEARGELSLIADVVMPEGTGPLYLEQERLRVKLETEGLFEPSRKRTLPAFPKVLGVVTSPTGAAIQDIYKVVQDRYPLVELLLAPTMVQGDEAALGITAALRGLNEDGRADIIIVARGGGSIEELWPFNEEIVARAIHASTIPVVSGVGHERDLTIADLVADVRSPTPTAAAEMAVPDGAALARQVMALKEAAGVAVNSRFARQRQGLEGLLGRLSRAVPDIDQWRRRIDDMTHDATAALSQRLRLSLAEVGGLESRVRALDPAAVLARGYAVVEREQPREAVTSTSQVASGDLLNITVVDGSIPATAGRRPAVVRRSRPVKVPAGDRLF